MGGSAGSSAGASGVVAGVQNLADLHDPSLQPRLVTRLQQGIRRPKVYTDGTIRYGNLAVTGELTNLQEALGNDKWKEAMDAEYSALMRNRTWHLVPPSKGTNVVDCKWVYKLKKKAYGSID